MFRYDKAFAPVEQEVDKARFLKDFKTLSNSLIPKLSKIRADSPLETVIKAEIAINDGKNDEAKTLLTHALDLAKDHPDPLALLGILEFQTGDERKALDLLSKLRFTDADISSLTPREARLSIQALEARGTIHERAGRWRDALQSFQLLVDIALRTYKNSIDENARNFVEYALTSIPALYLNLGDSPNTIEAYRAALRFPFNLNVEKRQKTLRSFANFLLLKCSPADWRPYKISGDVGVFVPSNLVEEAVLVILLLDDLVRRGGYSFARMAEQLTPLANLLTIAWTRKNQSGFLLEPLEKALQCVSATSSESHLWFQYALALISARKFSRAMTALEEHLQFDPVDPTSYLVACKLCLNHLGRPADVIKYAQKAVDLGGPLLYRSYHAYGLGKLSLSLSTTLSSQERKERQLEALEALQLAHKTALSGAGSNAEILFHLALTYAHIREIERATSCLTSALQCTSISSSRNSWKHLYLEILLLSSQKELVRALKCARAALLQFPEEIALLKVCARLELQLAETSQETAAALATLQRAFAALRNQISERRTLKNDDDDAVSTVRYTASAYASPLDDMSSVATSEAMSRKDTAGTKSVSALSDDSRTGFGSVLPPSARAEADLWLEAARLFIDAEMFSEALSCVMEAKATGSFTADILFLEGLINEKQFSAPNVSLSPSPSSLSSVSSSNNLNGSKDFGGSSSLSRELYEKALTLESTHVESLIRMAAIHEAEGDLISAERNYTLALKVDPLNYEAWGLLGTMHLNANRNKNEKDEKASDYLLKALELENTSPIIPFGSIAVEL